jgi:hypothetical protein
MNIEKKVYEYTTKHKQGFTSAEIDELLKEFPDIDMEKFNYAMDGNTCMLIDEEVIMYHIDVLKALICGLEKRDLYNFEID